MILKVAFILSVCLLVPSLCMEQQIVGIIGESIRIVCPGANSEAHVRWADYVHNRQDDPELIFDSTDNSEFKVSDTHPYKDNYMIDTDYAFTIKNLSQEDGGEYICEVTGPEGSDEIMNKYDLMVVGKPMCSGSTTATVGGSVELECEVKYRGSMPMVDWFDPNQEKLRSEDRTVIRLMKKALVLTDLTAENDKEVYMCKLSIDDFMQSCTMTLNVEYPLSNVQIVPKKASYNAGETIKCLADGNPAPKISFQPEGEGEQGTGWTSLIVKEEWVGKPQEIICTASSNVGGVPTILTTNITFSALEAPKTTQAPTRPPEPQATAKSGETKPGPNQAGIIGGLIAAVAIIIIIVVIVVIVRKRSSKKPKEDDEDAITVIQSKTSSNKQSIEENGRPSS